MNQFGWIDFSPAHRNKVMQVMDMLKVEGVIDELGLGTIRDAISDRLFPGTSTIQTRAKYFLLIPWIIQDLERSGKMDQFQSELEKAEIHFIKTLRSKPNSGGIIGATLRNANPKRKPSSVYWNGLKTFNILHFKGSLSDYIQYQKRNLKSRQARRRQLIDSDGNVQGDDKDANHLYEPSLWTSIPKPAANWKEDLDIELTADEALFLREKIIQSSTDSLWAFTLKYCADEAKDFSTLADFLSIGQLPNELRDIIQLAVDFNKIMEGALIRYNLLIQVNRENGRANELQPFWDKYREEIKAFDWSHWSFEKLWRYCPFTNVSARIFVERWIDMVRAPSFNQTGADQLLKDREFRLKGYKRARLSDKALAQKQQVFTGVSFFDDHTVSYLTYRWNNVKTFLNDIHNGLHSNATAY